MVAEPLEHCGRANDVAEENGREHALAEILGREPEGMRARELDRVPRLITDHPGVVPGRDLIGVAGRDGELRAVVHSHRERARDRVTEVAVQAGARAADRRDVLRPAPTRPEQEAADRDLVEGDDVHPSGREVPDLVGRRKALPLQARHVARIVACDACFRKPRVPRAQGERGCCKRNTCCRASHLALGPHKTYRAIGTRS